MSDGDVRGFLHVCCMGGYREVIWEIIHALLESRLYDRSVTIDMAVLGSEDEQRFVDDLIKPFERFRIVYRSTDLAEYEFPGLALVQDACRTWDGPVYYLHTKGVSYSPYNQYAHHWRRLMLDEVVTHHERCLAALNSCHTAGANWSDAGLYSGNFWWARSAHIRRLPDIRELQRNPRDVTIGVRIDGDSPIRRGVGPVWNQRLQCEYWLHMVPGRAARMGPSRENLYRELCWTTPVADVVNELLAVSPGRRYAELRVGGASPYFAAIRADRKVSVTLGSPGGSPQADLETQFFTSEPPDAGYDVILLEVRHDPAHLADLIDRCLPRLAKDGAVVVRYANPPSAWHQREVGEPKSEWTGQVWRAVVDFRIRHPECEVFTVDTDWGCAVIRPGCRARQAPGVESVNDLDWKALAERRRQLLNVVDVAWFRRNLYATPYLSGVARPAGVTDVANLLVAAGGLDSYLQIGCEEDVFDRIIVPVRHRVAAGENAPRERYDVVLVDDAADLESAVDRASDDGWILVGAPLPDEFQETHPDFDWWTEELDGDALVVLRRSGSGSSPPDSLLSTFLNAEPPREDHRSVIRLATQPYEGNLEVLHSAIDLDPEDIRSTLFLGDAYFGRGDSAAARSWYLRAADLRDWWWKGFDTAIYIAMLRVARLMEEAGESAQSVRDAFLRAWEICPDRPTPLYAVVRRYRLEQRYQLGYLYGKPAADIPCPDPEGPRMRGEVPGWRVRDELARCAFMIGKRDEAFALWRELLLRSDIPDEDRARIVECRDECLPTMLEVASAYPEQTVREVLSRSGDPDVVVSMVAGPGLPAAEHTLNSFLNCCGDIGRVGRFLIVDSGLTPEGRATLRERYGFLEFAEAGTVDLSSLRRQVGERLWLHLGRGWRFFSPGDLITRLEAVLAADPRVYRVAVNSGDVDAAGGPAMYDTARLDLAGGFEPAASDEDALSALSDRAVAAGLRTAALDEVVCERQTLITVIGRGNSGTRAISQTLMRSGVFMGEPIKADSADLIPADDMYEACRIIARYIPWLGGLEWDFGPVQTMPIPAEFTRLVECYLSSVLSSTAPLAGWKLPETTLCYPWIRRLFPDIRYIFWVRNPLDCITNHHFTDDLSGFGIEYPPTDDPYLRRAISWKYQDDLVAATPRPRHWIAVRLEDFITRQDRELARLAEFLGIPLTAIPVRRDPIDRHKRMPGLPFPDFLVPAMRNHHYDVADGGSSQ